MKVFLLMSILCLTVCQASKIDKYDQKPQFHITPPQGHWINDPNGPILFNGTYHLFAQYNPFAAYWGNMSWFHWTSEDGVFWSENNVAIQNDLPYDIGGAFSGSVLEIDKTPVLFYTCVDEHDGESQCTAVPTVSSSTDSKLTKWSKNINNPVISFNNLTSKGGVPAQFRDPSLWTDPTTPGVVYMATAAELNGTGCVIVYETTVDKVSSRDWTFKSILWNSSNEYSTYSTYMVECPDLYTVGYTPNPLYALKFSVMEERRELYELGSYDVKAGQFHRDVANYPLRLEYDYGPNNNFYASKTFLASGPEDEKETRLLWGWSPEQDNETYSLARDWAGVMSLPREVQYNEDHHLLTFQPFAALAALRDAENHKEFKSISLTPSAGFAGDSKIQTITVSLNGVHSLAFELQVDFTLTRHSNTSNWCGASENSAVTNSTLEFGVHGRTSTPDVEGVAKYFTAAGIRLDCSSGDGVMSSVVDISASGSSETAYSAMSTTRVIPVSLENYNLYDKHFTDSNVLTLSMHAFFDHSMVEIYSLDGLAASTFRVYPAKENDGVSLYSTVQSGSGIKVEAKSVKFWPMKSIWDKK